MEIEMLLDNLWTRKQLFYSKAVTYWVLMHYMLGRTSGKHWEVLWCLVSPSSLEHVQKVLSHSGRCIWWLQH